MNTFLRLLAVSMVLLLSAGQALPGDSLGSPRIDDQKRRGAASLEASDSLGRSAQPGTQRVPDEILVTFREGLTDSNCRESISAAGHTVLRRFRFARNPLAKQNRRYLVRIHPGWSLEEALEAVRRLSGVEEAQPNYIYRALQQPDDPYFYLQWGHENVGDDSAYTEFGLRGPDPRVSGADIGAVRARELYAGMTPDTILVGVIDTGVNLDHPDLGESIWTNPGEVPGNGSDDDSNGYIDDVHGWDFVGDDNDPDDEDGHGTHVAGVIGAITDNGTGVAGTAPNAELMPLRFLDSDGTGYTDDLIDAIYYGIHNGARVINNSWGGGAFDPALEDAIIEARDAGVLFVAASGNDASDNDIVPHYPSSYDSDNIVSVAASTPWRDRADFSNWGQLSVDIAAPGEEIISTNPTDGDDGFPEMAYQLCYPASYPNPIPWSGTSMASPHVSAAAAILFGLGPTLWPGTWQIMSPTEQMIAVRDRILDRSSRWAALSGTTVTDGHLDLSNLVEDDDTPPDPVGPSLEVVTTGRQFVTLRWMASGDDGLVGSANYYDLRSQQGPTIDFPTATPVEGIWTPSPAGFIETFSLAGLQPGTEYTVGLEVVDNVGNRSGWTDLTVTTRPQALFFADDMESGPNGWTTDIPWDLTTASSSSPSHSWTDSPGGSYAAGRNVSLTSPEIVTDGSALAVTYWQRYDIEDGWDFGYVEARSFVAGGWSPWTAMRSFTGTDLAWSSVTANLPVTGDLVQIRFRLETDAVNQADGWYVDDVSVHVSASPPATTLLFEDAFDGNDCSNWQLAGSWACESNSLSDSPGSDYPFNNRASAQLSAPLSLEGTQAVEVSFEFASFNYEAGYDFLFFEYSLDGVNWRRVGRFTGSQSGAQSYDLDPLAGMPAVYFRFRSLSDYGNSYAGAEIDDFRVRVAESNGCTGDAECDDGLFCNGVETCNTGSGTCEAGTPPDCDDGDPCTADGCDPSTGCTNDPIPDADTDGACDAIDCAPLDGQFQTIPGEVGPTVTMVQSLDTGSAILAWDAVPQAAHYNTYSSASPISSTMTCLESGDALGDGPMRTEDGTLPAPGQLIHYLVSAENPCGEGILGYPCMTGGSGGCAPVPPRDDPAFCSTPPQLFGPSPQPVPPDNPIHARLSIAKTLN